MKTYVDAALGALEDAGRLRDVREMPESVTCFASNDYLGLSKDLSVRTAIADAVLAHGMGPRGSALICGHTSHHGALERRLADLVAQPAAMLTPTGYAANLAVFDALADDDLHVFSDALNHASIVDGCQRAKRRGASVDVYRHGDVADLERRLRASPKRRKLVVTETVFSMDGDLAPLRAIKALTTEHDATLVTDEGHATLVFGRTGAGVAEHLGVEVDVHVGTCSKAVGAVGGFVACGESIARLLRNRARPYVFSTALPVPIVLGIDAALTAATPKRRARLWSNTERLCQSLKRPAVSPIVPVVIGEEHRTMAVGRRLLEAGFLVASVRPPTVPPNTSRLRITVSADHDADQIESLARALSNALGSDS